MCQLTHPLPLRGSYCTTCQLANTPHCLCVCRYVAHSSSYQEFKAGGYVAYFSLEGERAAAGKAGSDSDTSECAATQGRLPSSQQRATQHV